MTTSTLTRCACGTHLLLANSPVPHCDDGVEHSETACIPCPAVSR